MEPQPTKPNEQPSQLDESSVFYLNSRLSQCQSDVISLCRDFDESQKKDPTGQPNNLIVRAITTITCLEELVNYAQLKIKRLEKEKLVAQ
jgi:hypothetical protein